MLGWYGLHDTSSNNSTMYDTDLSPNHAEGDTGSPAYSASIPADEHQHPHNKEHHLQIEVGSHGESSVAEQNNNRSTSETMRGVAQPTGISANDEMAGISKSSMRQGQTPPLPFEGITGQSLLNGGLGDKKMGGRKLIGMRYLFPPPSDGLSLLEKARVWVARHDYKYFVGWSEDQLSRIDPTLRPICTITPDLYKMHMNRSEYCRNVKLKYCLESDADWAQEFREKLAKPYNKGGFSGLCQAKIVAAELWRKHSENYKSHQARYPNPKSKYRARRMSSSLSDQLPNSGENLFVPPNEFIRYRQEANPEIYQHNEVLKASEPASVIRFMKNSSFSDCDGSRDTFPEDVVSKAVSEPKDPGRMYFDRDIGSIGNPGVVIKQEYPTPENNGIEDTFKQGFDQPLIHGTLYPLDPFKSRPQLFPPPIMESYFNPVGPVCPASASGAEPTVTAQPKKNISGRTHDYRKSERGLSYLFPSLIDQQLSLLDKVRITVLRHKNNYFLGWTEEQLKRVDPLVRPKMPVTRELYKEYCHRNAMKYDSNLQFAMESQTHWAIEFRDRLVKPPNEGGFHSLCEVKQEAGRLWKEFSGRYKMHNVVKAQMDMNNEHSRNPAILVERTESACSSVMDDTTDLRSTTSSPGPRLDRITSPVRKFISRSANSSPNPACDVPTLRYLMADLPPSPEVHNARKRKQSDDSGCASLPSPTNSGAVEADIYKHNFAHKPASFTGEFQMLNSAPFRTAFTFQDSMPNRSNSYMHAKIPKLQQISSGVASEVTNSMLFAPLPPELSVVNQLIIWLQRHRNNYFIGWTQGQMDKLNPFLRPLYVVTPEVLKSHVSPTMFAMFDKVEEVMGLPTEWAKKFQDKLGSPPEQGGFRTIEEALAEAVEIWMTHCQPKVSPPQEKSVQNPGLSRLKDMFRAKTNMQGLNTQNVIQSERADATNTLEGLLHSKHGNVEVKPQRRDVTAEQEPTTADEAALDLSKKNPPVSTTDLKVPSKEKYEEISRNSSTNGTALTSLWNCRKQLQELCRDSVASSWQDRLQPHIGLLHEKLGENYQLPTSVSDCMVDLMLVLLHESLIKT